ncbi:MAG: hypothetical protein HYX37_07610 [Rhizobiales bacterium]|nr:hypothetical protein [Hyphomicrobiales bacterium]
MKWEITPQGFIYQNDCTRKIILVGADGIKREVTEAGSSFGEFHVYGLGTDWILIDPAPTSSGELQIDVTCPNCTSHLSIPIEPCALSVSSPIEKKIAVVLIGFPIYGLGFLLGHGLYWSLGWLFVPIMFWDEKQGIIDVLKMWVRDGKVAWKKYLKDVEKMWKILWD